MVDYDTPYYIENVENFLSLNNHNEAIDLMKKVSKATCYSYHALCMVAQDRFVANTMDSFVEELKTLC